MKWFEVDRGGLSRLLERKGKEFVLHELIQNAWDQNVTRVDVTLVKEPGSRVAELVVEDDDPAGFTNLSHAWTLFAESTKKGAAEKRGRFNLGEKLVLALCDEAEIVTTSGGVRFDAEGRHVTRKRRERGSRFRGILRLTNAELEACSEAMARLLPPSGVVTTFNGVPLQDRQPVAIFEASLRTEVADAEGNLRSATRTTPVRVIKPLPGETASLYEMGIPVVETGDAYHIDVLQKVPLGFDREHVPPAFLRHLRALVLNNTHELLKPEQARETWVREAMGTTHVAAEAVRTVVNHRFGQKSVVYDPSDAEANKLAIVDGYHVVHGSQLSGEEWANVRKAGALLPAGRVTPSPKAFAEGGAKIKLLPESEWSSHIRATVALYQRLAQMMIGRAIEVRIAVDADVKWLACYGPAGLMYLNKHRLGVKFFLEGPSERVLDLLIHELGHEYSGDHLSSDYYDALTKLGARLALGVAADPGLLAYRPDEHVSDS
ncbi:MULTISPECIES: ATP-binding protein [Roseomonadaceae]|uniref:ATP-binding protein n=1 Tax=Falsiroseomonas oleicola TaxID=2801474 RepID=A0ABS6HEA9_9PROT|nr:ATP-binding protein [Roseomonas oleicola]MBU8546147.1 ATP-binding protein [Roseomonas oleicola]